MLRNCNAFLHKESFTPKAKVTNCRGRKRVPTERQCSSTRRCKAGKGHQANRNNKSSYSYHKKPQQKTISSHKTFQSPLTKGIYRATTPTANRRNGVVPPMGSYIHYLCRLQFTFTERGIYLGVHHSETISNLPSDDAGRVSVSNVSGAGSHQ